MSDEKLKAPSQIFRWFEKMKSNYESGIQRVLGQFEQYSEKQQARIDAAHQQQIKQQQQQIEKLTEEVAFYRQQITHQQQTIEQLNGRYDAVMHRLINENTQHNKFKDIFDEHDFVEPFPEELLSDSSIKNEDKDPVPTTDQSTAEQPVETEPKNSTHSKESNGVDNEPEPNSNETSFNSNEQFNQAVQLRQQQQYSEAIELFKQLAYQGHARAMGAMGRSYFTGEGVKVDQLQGLAWLIKAAQHELPQAIKRCEQFQEADPELYQQALSISEHLFE